MGRQLSIETLLLDGQFGNGANSARYDVLPNMLLKIRSIEILLQYFHHFLYPEIPSGLIVVRFPNHLRMIA